MRTVRTLALFALPMLFLGVPYFGTTISQAQSHRHPDEMEWDVPTAWVEFSANVTMRDATKAVRGTGRVYQNQDGSRREEWQLGDQLFAPPAGAMTQFFEQHGGKSSFVRATAEEKREAAKLHPHDRKAYWERVFAKKGKEPVVVEADK